MKWAATTRAGLIAAVLALCAGVSAGAQQAAEPSLGDVARKTRKEHAAPHPPSRELVNEEEDGPDTTGVWRIHMCRQTPCGELTITLPKTPKWTRGKDEPRPVVIALPGAEEDANRVIRIYAAQSLQQTYGWVNTAAQQFLQGWFAREEYFGKAAHIVRLEQVLLDNQAAALTHFTVTPGAEKYRGFSVVTGSGGGYYGFACTYREEDAKAAESICDAIVKSAHNQVLDPALRQPYPYSPPYYPPRYDPPEDPE